MSIRLYNSYTPGTRNRALSDFSEITKAKPEKSLIKKNHRNKGRNNRGVITIRHRGGGHKRSYRLIDFKRDKYGIQGKVASIEYDPNRNARIALIYYIDGEKNYITLRLPSKEIRLIRKECFATIGEVGNNDVFLVQSGKAGRTRWLGKRPTVRGSVMNPCDHPHGGGEGRTPIGRTRPLTPWGKPALGMKTRKNKKLSDAYILRRRS